MYLITDVRLSQLNQLLKLAKILNSKNLPYEKKELEKLIKKSIDSFNGKITDPSNRQYIFTLTEINTQKLIGTSQITAKHGNKQSPHVYLQILNSQYYSTSLDIIKNHKMLQIGFDYEGYVEVGGLVVDPKYRLLKEKIGKQLSLVRFLFMSQVPKQFGTKVIAELLPAKNQKNEYALWNDLGYKLTGLQYEQADVISRMNKEFIKSLFIDTPICVSLLSKQTQQAIGVERKDSKSAAYMLKRMGFRNHLRVDPFDGGPYYEAEIDNITTIKDTRILKIFAINFDSNKFEKQDMLISVFHNKFANNAEFICTRAKIIQNNSNIYVESHILDLLKVSNADEVYGLKLN